MFIKYVILCKQTLEILNFNEFFFSFMFILYYYIRYIVINQQLVLYIHFIFSFCKYFKLHIEQLFHRWAMF